MVVTAAAVTGRLSRLIFPAMPHILGEAYGVRILLSMGLYFCRAMLEL